MKNNPAPWLSVVIPTLNERQTLPLCVAALVGGLPAGEMEIIVADGGSTDGTVAYADGHPRLITLPCTRGRARQLNAGAQAARGRYFWFLHADTLPPPDWPRHLQSAVGGEPACFSLRFIGQEGSKMLRFFSAGSRKPWWWVRFGDQSLFVSRADFVRAGGYREDHQLMEGHELVQRLRRTTGAFRVLPAAVSTSARRYQEHGVFYTQLMFVLVFSGYYLRLPQAALVRLYQWGFRGGSTDT